MLQNWDMGQILSLPLPKVGHAEDYSDTRKIQRLRLGWNPQTQVSEASMLTTRPPKLLRRKDSIKVNLKEVEW